MSEVKDFKTGDEVLIRGTVAVNGYYQKNYNLIRVVTRDNGEVVWCLPSELEKVPTLENIINTSGDPERNEV